MEESCKSITNIEEYCNGLLNILQSIDAEVRNRHLENEQWFINFQDKLNELSVK